MTFQSFWLLFAEFGSSAIEASVGRRDSLLTLLRSVRLKPGLNLAIAMAIFRWRSLSIDCAKTLQSLSTISVRAALIYPLYCISIASIWLMYRLCIAPVYPLYGRWYEVRITNFQRISCCTRNFVCRTHCANRKKNHRQNGSSLKTTIKIATITEQWPPIRQLSLRIDVYCYGKLWRARLMVRR